MPKRFYEDDDYAARLKELSSGEAEDDPSRLWPSQKIPAAELQAAEKIRAKYTLRKTYVSNFTARSDGELILYVNDAIAAIPLLKPYKGFYENNTGKAKVTIKRLVGASAVAAANGCLAKEFCRDCRPGPGFPPPAGRPPRVPAGGNPRESLPFLTFSTKFVALRRWSD